MEYYSIGYITNPKMPDVTQDDVSKLTHINLAFGLVKDGLLDTHQLTNIGCIEQFRRWNPAVKIVLSVGGWGAGGFSTMAMTDAGRRAFAASCLDYVNAHGLDGIDIDWEYPCSDSAGIDADPRDRENYTALLQALRDALGQNRIVSLAAGAGDYFVRDTEMDKVAEIVDYVQLMTYDMRNGATPPRGARRFEWRRRQDQHALHCRPVPQRRRAAAQAHRRHRVLRPQLLRRAERQQRPAAAGRQRRRIRP